MVLALDNVKKSFPDGFMHVFACEVSKPVQDFIKTYIKPGVLYGDIKKRRLAETPGGLHLYTAGFPCQPFSKSGLGLGYADEARGQLVVYCIAHIKVNKPTSFIIENVVALLEQHPEFFKVIIMQLMEIKSGGGEQL